MSCDGYRVDDHVIDGSWMLNVIITDLQIETTVRVRGDMHVGGVMYHLVSGIDGHDWSDHALFWPEKNQWLLRTKSTLDQYSVDAETRLIFTPTHKMLCVALPDLRHVTLRVSFSCRCFSAVLDVCRQLGLRYGEEMSLSRRLRKHHLKSNFQRLDTPSSAHSASLNSSADTSRLAHGVARNGSSISSDSMNSLPAYSSYSRTRHRSHLNGTLNSTSNSDDFCLNGSRHDTSLNMSSGEVSLDSNLAYSPTVSSMQAKNLLVYPKSLMEKARLNAGWLDSSLSLMEQGVREFDTLALRFKYYSFADLDPKQDAVRINQMFEQAKWQVLNDEVECTEEEMLLFGGLQLQSTLQSCQDEIDSQANMYNTYNHHMTAGTTYRDRQSVGTLKEQNDIGDIDSALSALEVQLENTHVHSNGRSGHLLTNIPRLTDHMRMMRLKVFTMKSYKQYWFLLKELHLYIYKSETSENAYYTIPLKGCEITPMLNISNDRFGFKLEVPSMEGMVEYLIRCDSERQYAKWLTACKFASKGRTMADASFSAEVDNILELLRLQRPSQNVVLNTQQLEINPADFVPPRFLKKLKPKSLSRRLLESHANVSLYGAIEAKLSYIRSWKSLPEFGISYFLVRFLNSKRDEILGVAYNRLIRMEVTGEHVKTWQYSTMKAWNVNWEARHMMVQFDEGNVVFSCLSADCKTVHEFIGGYIFLHMRSKSVSPQSPDEEQFYKLTSGWN